MKRISILILVILGSFFLNACSIVSNEVSFETFGGDEVEPMRVFLSGSVELPQVNKVGSVFVGWYLDSELTEPYEEGQKIKSDVTLYAKWTKSLNRFIQDIEGASFYQIDFESNDYTIRIQVSPRKIYEKTTNKYYDTTEVLINKGLVGTPVMSYIEPGDTCWTQSDITTEIFENIKKGHEAILDTWYPSKLQTSWFDQEGDVYTLQDDKYYWAGLAHLDFYTITVTEKTFEIFAQVNSLNRIKVIYSHIDDLVIEEPEMNVCPVNP